MSISTITHLNFTGNASQALEFYHSVFGGDLMIGTYGRSGVPHDSTDPAKAVVDPVPPNSANAGRVSFGMLIAESGFRLAAYDVFDSEGPALASGGLPGALPRAAGLTHTEPFFIVLNGDTREEVSSLWDGLADGGTIIQALAPSAFSPAYGMVTDRYGVTWVFGAAS